MPSHDFDGDARATAIRALLRTPLLRRAVDEDAFQQVATRRTMLGTWFRDNLGWALTVDVRAGVARLHKRSTTPDPRRGPQTIRATPRPFDRQRFQLLALTCAQMLRRPHSTLGDLADALARICNASDDLLTLDITKQGDRRAFVDGLLWLVHMGGVAVTAGDLENYAQAKDVDAVLRANTTVLPLLLSSDTPPSRLGPNPGTSEDLVAQLSAEPQYGTVATEPEAADRRSRNRWARHTALRALIDDPVVDLGSLHPAARAYLETSSGRDKAIVVAQEVGFTVERHADVWLAIDPTNESSIGRFSPSGKGSKVQQTAALVLQALVGPERLGRRQRAARSREAVESMVDDALRQNPAWAKTSRSEGGAKALCGAALDLLEEFGLVQRRGDQVVPCPAAARFSVEIDS